MEVIKRIECCFNLRIKCFIIGYMHLIASLTDIMIHFITVAMVTNGFQCDMTVESLASVNWPWLEPFLLFINLGTHGFYPFPIMRRNFFLQYMPEAVESRCYPGMFHVELIDILNFMINAIWLRFVKAYLVALYQKDPEPMRMFFGLSFVKLMLQVLYFSYQPDFRHSTSMEIYWFVKLIDIILAAIFLVIIHAYIKTLRREKAQVEDQPPPYIECLITTQVIQENNVVKKDIDVVVPEAKTEGESNTNKATPSN